MTISLDILSIPYERTGLPGDYRKICRGISLSFFTGPSSIPAPPADRPAAVPRSQGVRRWLGG